MSVNPRHPKINKSNIEAILNGLEDNHRNAQSQRTSNAGSKFIPSGSLDENGLPTGEGTIVGSGANGGGISPWVNDTTPPGMPQGLKVFSESSIIYVTWDGSLAGGTPPDFDHVSVFVDDVEKATFSTAGTYPTDSYEPDSIHNVTARAWDNAHASDGSPKPNGSALTDPVQVKVKSAVDTGMIEDAQNKAQEALDKIAGVSSTADQASKDAAAAQSAASAAQSAADGKNRIFTSASEPSHDGLAKGDLWMQLNSDGHVTGIQVWNGSAFRDYVLMAQQVLVAGSVGTVSLADGAVTADKVTASEALLEKLLVRKVKADEIDVGSLSAAIVQSGRFVTPDGLTGFDETGFWVKNPNGGYDFSASHNGVHLTGELQTGHDDASHFKIKNNNADTPNGEKRSTGVIEFYSYRDPKHPIGALTGWDTGAVSQLVLGESFDDATYRNGSITVSSVNASNSTDNTSIDLFSNYNEIMSTPLNNGHFAFVVVESDNERQKSKAQLSADEVDIAGDVHENNVNHNHRDRRIFSWTSTWSGVPQNPQYVEAEMDYIVASPGEGQWFISNTGARVGGNGEYSIGFVIEDNNNNRALIYQHKDITPPKNGGVDNFSYSNTFFLLNGNYHIKLVTQSWGTVNIDMGAPDFLFHNWAVQPDSYARYAFITRL